MCTAQGAFGTLLAQAQSPFIRGGNVRAQFIAVNALGRGGVSIHPGVMCNEVKRKVGTGVSGAVALHSGVMCNGQRKVGTGKVAVQSPSIRA
jgi:hypothetical protein